MKVTAFGGRGCGKILIIINTNYEAQKTILHQHVY